MVKGKSAKKQIFLVIRCSELGEKLRDARPVKVQASGFARYVMEREKPLPKNQVRQDLDPFLEMYIFIGNGVR
jgi:hypothetical protein